MLVYDIIRIITIIYLLAVNLTAFIMYGLDKMKAKKHRWRISEMTLLMAAALGGAWGAALGILIFRHKTRKLRFRVVTAIALVLYTALLVCLLQYGSVRELFL
ncbi:MAG: DUF1294 domain-containing protein [Lachnospiraceae bacterium]|nr:DUF1294 domain-containing protein [Lachnospiraceae bacterium]